MRRLGMLLLIGLIGMVLLAVIGPEIGGIGIVSQAGETLRDIAGGLAEWLGFSVRGFAPDG